jgi:hypothetical protein
MATAKRYRPWLPDQQYLLPPAPRDWLPEKLSADSGYWSNDNAEFCAELGVDAHIATGRLEHGGRPQPVRGRPPKNLDAKGKMSRKLRTKAGRAV